LLGVSFAVSRPSGPYGMRKITGRLIMAMMKLSGGERLAKVERDLAMDIVAPHDGKQIKDEPYHHWVAHRFESYSPQWQSRDYFMDTIEVTSGWSQLPKLYARMRSCESWASSFRRSTPLILRMVILRVTGMPTPAKAGRLPASGDETCARHHAAKRPDFGVAWDRNSHLSPNGGPRRTRLVPARVQRQGGCGLNRDCSNARNNLTRAGTWARLAVMATTSA
jgi:hypothetical protein